MIRATLTQPMSTKAMTSTSMPLSTWLMGKSRKINTTAMANMIAEKALKTSVPRINRFNSPCY
jgi:hypothetical protein